MCASHTIGFLSLLSQKTNLIRRADADGRLQHVADLDVAARAALRKIHSACMEGKKRGGFKKKN